MYVIINIIYIYIQCYINAYILLIEESQLSYMIITINIFLKK